MRDPTIPERIGRYQIERRLGAGGMAEAFLAYLEGAGGFQKAVVVKRLLPHLWADKRAVGMFVHEARIGMRLSHPNIVTVHELGEDGGTYFLAMEYIAGLTLKSAAKRAWALSREVPLDVVLRAIADTARGLDYAHNLKGENGALAGLIHRDISPDNLMLSREGVTKILDFGIVKHGDGGGPTTQTGELKGKVGFMSPEQLEGHELDARADLFSLGVSFYWLLARRRPFRGATEIQVLRAVLELEPEPLASIAPHVSADVVAIVTQLLEKDRARRTPSAAHLLKQLELIIGRTDAAGESGRFADDMMRYSANPPEDVDDEVIRGFAELSEPAAGERPEGTRVTLPELPSLPLGLLASRPSGEVEAITAVTPSPLAQSTQREDLLGLGLMHLESPTGPVFALSEAAVPAPPTGPTKRMRMVDNLDEPTDFITARRPKKGARSRVVFAALAALVIAPSLVVALLLSSTRGGEPASPVVVPATVARPSVAAQAPAAPVDEQPAPQGVDSAPTGEIPRPLGNDEGAAGDGDADPPDDDGAEPTERSAPAARRITAEGPPSVAWLSGDGKRLGRGSGVLELPRESSTIIAVDVETGARTALAVRDRVSYAALPKGRLSFVVLPWAEVRLKDKSLGTTPMKPVDVVAGSYRVTLVYQGEQVTKTVRVSPKKEAVVKHDFRH